MEKLSVKFAFVALLAVACLMFTITIQSVEANRLLPEQTHVVHYEASPQVVKPQQDFHCREGCHVSCIPIQLTIRCVCLC
ncbi:hypothetical protein N665_1354s0006 [Sinapis alba]|nr:hypothetical protein N665_1354s0006 [Sinapis alba]